MSGWEVVILLSKSLTYIAMLAIPGAFLLGFLLQRADCQSQSALCLLLRRKLLLYYLIPAVIVGIVSVNLFFLAQVGAVNQQGVAGMFDQDMAAIMATTALGDGVQWRLFGFMLAALASGLMFLTLTSSPATRQLHWPIYALLVLATALFMRSFAILGHTSVEGLSAQLAVSLHLLCVGVWIGALMPLWILCRVQERGSAESEVKESKAEESGATTKGVEEGRATEGLQILTRVMEDFGKAGWGFVMILVVSGIYLLFVLLESPEDLLGSMYGRLLLIKMIVAVALMALGAFNKFRLVPSLRNAERYPANLQRLRRSIQLEMVLAVLILLLVASFTTVFGPMH